MRILFVAPFYYPELKFGGPPKRLHAMANALHANGHDVDVLTIDSEEGDRSNRADYGGVSVQYLPWRGRALNAFPTSLQAVRGAVRSADVVHCFGLYNFICPAAVRVARRATKPVLLEPMGMYVPRVRTVALKRIYNATITRWMAKGVAAIVATSEIELAELQPLSRFARVVLRRNGIDVAEFRTLPARELMRQRWGIPPDAKVVLYVGRISEKKRLLELVTAFEQAGVADAKLVIAGPVSEPSYASAMHRDVQRSSRKDDILVTEPVYDEHLKAALSAADLFVLPSLNENFGNAAAEAVAATLPVLLTETCGIAPIIDGRAGMAVRLGIEPLAQGMRQMLDPVIRDQFLVNREQVKRELSWEEPIRQQIEIYREAIARNTEKLKR